MGHGHYNRTFQIRSFTPFSGLTWNSKTHVYDRASFVEMVEETKDLTDVEFSAWCEKEKENFESFKDECRQLEEFAIYMDQCALQEKEDKKRAIGVQRRKE